MRGLDPNGLRTLHRNVSDELVRAVRADAGHDTIEGMLRLLDALERRISELTENPTVSVSQRQLVADKGATTRHNGGGRHGRGADT